MLCAVGNAVGTYDGSYGSGDWTTLDFGYISPSLRAVLCDAIQNRRLYGMKRVLI